MRVCLCVRLCVYIRCTYKNCLNLPIFMGLEHVRKDCPVVDAELGEDLPVDIDVLLLDISTSLFLAVVSKV